MVLQRWEPFREMDDLRQSMDRMVEEAFRPWGWRGRRGYAPAFDVYQTPETLVVKAAIPGVKPEDVEVTITGHMLTIKGETKAEEEVREEEYLLQERYHGVFSRTIALPNVLDTSKAEAHFENGVLTLTIPKHEAAKPRSVQVRVKKTVEAEKKKK